VRCGRGGAASNSLTLTVSDLGITRVSFWKGFIPTLKNDATARTADNKRTVHNLAMIWIGRMRAMIEQKNVEE